MSVDRIRLKELFGQAIEFADADARAAFLNRECAGNADLRRRVDALLSVHDQPAPALDEPMGRVPFAPEQTGAYTARPDFVETPPGTMISGRYKLLEQIGEGGMGTVWVAEQTEPVRRKVALKLIKAGMDSKSVLARFEAERQALAVMDHPNIAKVLDGGIVGQSSGSRETSDPHGTLTSSATGRPFFVMEYVKGVPITEYCDATRLSVPERLNLFVQVCHAVQHAHQKGIIHRDLKPSNILVAPYDDKPVPKVIDFGLAKAMHQSLTEKTLHTAHETVLGTPLYMSPEQAQLNNLDVDTRSDIYSLGVLLYELLTGTTPLEKQRFKEAAWEEIKRLIREEEPPRPSTRLSSNATLASLAAGRKIEPARLTKLVRGELDWIVMKSLEKDRTRRYDTANGFALDVQRYLAGEPVLAHPPSARYRLRKFVKRNKVQVLTASLVFFALLAGIIGTTVGLIEAKRQERLAVNAGIRESERADAETKERQRADEEKARAIKFRDQALNALRAMTNEDVEKLIGSSSELSANERDYLEAIAKRWQGFANQSGTDADSRIYRAEGHFQVALLWARLGRLKEALAEYESARDLQKTLVAEFPDIPKYQRDLGFTHENLGVLLDEFGQTKDAEAEYRSAQKLFRKLVDRYPDEPDYQNALAASHGGLGTLLKDDGKLEEARAEYLSACDLRKKLADRYPEIAEYQFRLATNYNDMGVLFNRFKKSDDALTEFLLAREIQVKLVEEFPDSPRFRYELAGTHYNMAGLHSVLGKKEKARTEYLLALDLQKKVAERYPAGLRYRRLLAKIQQDYAYLLVDLKKNEDAVAEYRTARDLQMKLIEQFPAHASLLSELGKTRCNFGILLEKIGRMEEARVEHLASIDITKKMIDVRPDLLEHRISLGGSYCNFGILIRNEGKPSESLEWFGLATHELQRVIDKEPSNVKAKWFLRNTYWNRAQAYDQLQKFTEAIKDWDRTIPLSEPEMRRAFRAFRATSQSQAGLVDQALAEVAELTRNPEWPAVLWYGFARVYAIASTKIADKQQEHADRAMELLQKAVKTGYKDAAQLKKETNLDPLRGREDFRKLLAELEKSLEK